MLEVQILLSRRDLILRRHAMEIRRNRLEIISILKERDGDHCFICKKPFIDENPTIDHWIPKAANGGEEISNLRLAHRKCNSIKSDLVPNSDGTIPKRIKKSYYDKKNNKKRILDSLCHVCNNGRKLRENEFCSECGSEPGPYDAPHYLKKPSQHCDHDFHWCWACSIGVVPRVRILLYS